MIQDQLFQFMQTRPFRPFRLKTAGGREHTIVHPESIAYGGERSALDVLPDNRFEVIDTDLIESIDGTNEAPAPTRAQDEDQDQD